MGEQFLSSNWHRVASLRARLQPHADVTRHRDRGRPWYSVRNTASAEVFRLSPTVYSFLGLLDGTRTVNQAWTMVADQLDAEAPTQDEVIRLLSRLHDADLLQTDERPDFEELVDRRRTRKWSKLWQRIGNPMSLRLPLWDPDRFLTRKLGWLAPLPAPLAMLLWLAVVAPAVVLAGVHLDELTLNLSDRMFSAEGLISMLLVFPIVKLMHEMGHAVAVKSGGGAVHEMGVMLLVLLPVPYVDASAASMFRSRWRRIGVGAAGMLVETFIASLALYAWLELQPGVLRAACYTTMVIAGVSTVLFNGNPLLRYDGYFILADLIGVPNLAGRAGRYWAWLSQKLLFGAKAPAPATIPGETKWLIAYWPLSFIARTTVMVTIVMTVANRFFAIGVILAVWTAATGLVWPIARGLWGVFAGPGLARQRRRAVTVTVAGLGALAAASVFVPFPLHTVAEGIVWLPEESMVRAGGDGFVERLAVAPGAAVIPGQIVLISSDPDRSASIWVEQAKVQALTLQYASEQFSDRVKGSITRRQLEVEQSKLTDAERRVTELVSRSRASGNFVVSQPNDLPGRYYKRGEVLGYVIPPDLRLARVLVGQSDVDLVRRHLVDAAVLAAGDLGRSFPARMVREVPAASDELPSKALAVEGGGAQPTNPRDHDTPRSLERMFQFDVEIPPEAASAASGGHVWVRFDHGSEPLALQGWRRLRQLFLTHFDA